MLLHDLVLAKCSIFGSYCLLNKKRLKFDIDKINDFVEEMAAIVPIIHSEVFQSGVDSLRSDSTEKKKPK